MIRLLEGKIHSKEERSIILMVGGIGYQVYVPSSTLAETETEITLFVHSHIKEDQFTLYGFKANKELKFFELLLTINGVGPKMAMAILEEPADLIQNAIYTGNIKVLTKISGVGKKKAERMILELKSKVSPTEGAAEYQEDTDINSDVMITLEGLGYKRNHITKILSTVEEKLEDEEAVIRYFLQNA